MSYNEFIAEKMGQWGEVCNFGLVDTVDKGIEAGKYFNEHNVDIIFLHAATYATSATVLPIHQRCQAKVVMLNLQPSDRVNYEKTSSAVAGALQCCSGARNANTFHRAGIL